MSRTTNTQRTGTSGRLCAVSGETATPAADGRTAAEDKLWAALYTHPDATAAELSMAAGIGRSTAGKVLVAWAKDGSVIRTPGAANRGRRVADHWKITNPTVDGNATADNAAEPAAETTVGMSDTGLHQPSTHPIGDEPNETMTTSVEDAPEPTDRATVDDSQAVGGGTPVPQHAGLQVAPDLPRKATRLRKGALRGMVEDFLREHPGENFTPHAIGVALHKSAGAVFNAVEKLISEGWAVRTNDAPKRYCYHDRGTTKSAHPIG